MLYLQTKNNNIIYVIINYAFNELTYEFKMRDIIKMLANLFSKNFNRLRFIKREKAKIAITFVNALNKVKYDLYYKIITFVIETKFMIYLQLHQKYTISNLTNKKLSNQRINFFKIIKAVEKSKQIYRLKLSLIMKIHSIISIAQLKSATLKSNLYNKFIERNFLLITKTHSAITKTKTKLIRQTFLYKIERFINKRITRNQLHYLIK